MYVPQEPVLVHQQSLVSIEMLHSDNSKQPPLYWRLGDLMMMMMMMMMFT